MTKNSQRAALLWTGGKDSCLALHESLQAGHDVVSLITFAPKNPNFLAHPLALIKLQAEALQIPHCVFEINEPIKESYIEALSTLQHEYALDAVVTGDIDTVAGHPNWIQECCSSLRLEVVTPLWGRDRESLLRKVLDLGFEVIFSYVKKPWLADDWVGRTLNSQTLSELQEVSRTTGMDLCGEEGEYHTLVLNAPLFRQPISLQNCKKVVSDSVSYLELY
jgi:uncharacterized protein (TIGR00290 family)